MTSAPARRSAIIGIGAVLAVLVFNAVSARSATASCSHYVSNNSDLTKFELRFAPFDNESLPNETSEPSAPVGSPRRGHCSGALCSGQPASPSCPNRIDVPRAGQWAIIAAPAQTAMPEPALCPDAMHVLLTNSCSTSVYHPPRGSRRLRTL
jgi:hypothetical protein